MKSIILRLRCNLHVKGQLAKILSSPDFKMQIEKKKKKNEGILIFQECFIARLELHSSLGLMCCLWLLKEQL